MKNAGQLELSRQGLPRDVVVVGASAGGLEPMYALLSSLPHQVRAVIAVVVHRGGYPGPSVLADLLARRARRRVVEPFEPVPVEPGVVYLGPRDLHLVFERGKVMGIRSAKEHFTRPAIDPLFVSAAREYGRRVVGVLLSGGGSDGVAGLIHIKAEGGMSLVQQPDEARQPSMPATALREDHVDASLSVADLSRVLRELMRGRTVWVPAP